MSKNYNLFNLIIFGNFMKLIVRLFSLMIHIDFTLLDNICNMHISILF